MANQKAPLEPYIQRAYHGKVSADQAPIFRRATSSGRTAPTLEKGRVNYIIMYRGSFNPPHRSHLELLCQAIWNSGPGMNIVAAVIRLCPDQHVRKKFERQPGTLMFTLKERAALWRGRLKVNDWYWVHERGEERFHECRDNIIEEAGADGYQVEFVPLVGPDCLGKCGRRCYDRVICSDVGRLGSMKGTCRRCWKERVPLEAFLKSRRSGKSSAFAGLMICIRELLRTNDKSRDERARFRSVLEKFRTNLLDDQKSMQTVYCAANSWPVTAMCRILRSTPSLDRTSSTMVRNIISQCSTAEELLMRLRDVVLNPDLLVQYVLEKKAWKRRWAGDVSGVVK